MTKPALYVFAISHYCEKARWALDHLGIAYELIHPPVGLHVKIARELGAARSSLPILIADGRLVQGSADIIDWADASAANAASCLTPDSVAEECRNIEKRVDALLGVHVRRFYYSEALVDYPSTVRRIFTRDLPMHHKLMTAMIWRVVRKRMIEGLDLGPEQGRESRQIIAMELSWLDELLSDGRRFLAGTRFTRADLAAASLLAPLAAPKEHALYASLEPPPILGEALAEWNDRPCFVWAREIYCAYR